MSQITTPLQNAAAITVVDTAQQRSLPTLPIFTRGPGADVVVSMLAMARSEGYGNTLVHGKKMTWFVARNTNVVCTWWDTCEI